MKQFTSFPPQLFLGLQKTLRLVPREAWLVPSQETIGQVAILTVSPLSWNTTASETTIDISSAFCLSNSAEANAAEAFVHMGGWPHESLLQQFKQNSIPEGFRLTFLVTGHGGESVIAVSVVISDAVDEAERHVLGMRYPIREMTGADWACITDGIEQYVLVNLINDEVRHLDCPPTPSDVGCSVPLAFAEDASGLVHRLTWDYQLIEYLEQARPTSVIIDFLDGIYIPEGQLNFGLGLPIGQREKNSTLTTKLRTLSEQLAYSVSTVPSVHSIAAIVRGGKSLFELPVERLKLCAAVDLPDNLFAPLVSGRELAIAFYGGRRAEVYYNGVQLREQLFEPEKKLWFSETRSWLATEKAKIGYLVDTKNPEQRRSITDRLLEQQEKRLAQLGTVMKLGDLCEISRGRIVEVEELAPATPVATGALLSRSNATWATASPKVGDRVADAFDILIPEFLRPGSTAVLIDFAHQVIVSSDVFVLRLKSKQVSSEYLSDFLDSTVGESLLSACISDGISGRLWQERLASIPVLVGDSTLSNALELHPGLEFSLEDHTAELRALRKGMFSAANKEDLAQRITQLTSKQNILSLVLRATEDFDSRVSLSYPYPIAFGYRLISRHLAPTDVCRQQLRVLENILAFLGCLSLVLLELYGPKAGRVVDLHKPLHSGIGPGQWRDIIERSTKALSDNDTGKLLIQACRNLRIEKKDTAGFGKEIDSLIREKNDFKHDRAPEVMSSLADKQRTSLSKVMEYLGFLSQFPLRLVCGNSASRTSAVVNVKTLVLMGDHQGWSRELIASAKPLVDDDLYLQLENEFLSLYPFITVSVCEKCNVREVFYVDKWDSKKAKKVHLKSFEHGHEKESSEIHDALMKLVEEERGTDHLSEIRYWFPRTRS